MSNSVDPDEPSHPDLGSLQKPFINAYGGEGVNIVTGQTNPEKASHNIIRRPS